MRSIPEIDWKKLRAMKDKLLQIACERIFEKVATVIEGRGSESHKAYLNLWKTLKKEDDELSTMFDDLKRSNAIYKIAAWKRNGLIGDEDLKQFSEETQESINIINQIQR